MTTILPQYNLDQLKHKILDLQNRTVITTATKGKVAREDLDFAIQAVMRLFEITNQLTTENATTEGMRARAQNEVTRLTTELNTLRSAPVQAPPTAQRTWDRAIEILKQMFQNDIEIVGIKDPEKLFERHLFDVAVAHDIEASSMQALWSYSFTAEGQRPCVRWMLAVLTNTEAAGNPVVPSTNEDFRAVATAAVRFRNLSWPGELGRMVYYGWPRAVVTRVMDLVVEITKASEPPKIVG